VASSDLIAAPESGVSPHPFDAVASSYDGSFTRTPLGRWYRNQVWKRLKVAFQPGDHVIDLGCGTGEDAIWLARRGVHVTATDASTAMLEITHQKATTAQVGHLVDLVHLDLNSIGSSPLPVLGEGQGVRADGAYSNFGPLNCSEDRRPLASALAGAIRPGGQVVLVVMGPLCPWEMLWHLCHFQFRTAFRRLRSGAAASISHGGTLPVWYPAISTLEAEFTPYFNVVERFGLGLLTPPTSMDGLVRRAPRLFSKLAVIDRHAGHLRPWLWFNDHYILHLERRRQ
jgi:SAM-dependent methyltransferase